MTSIEILESGARPFAPEGAGEPTANVSPAEQHTPAPPSRIVVLDLETTGFDPEADGVCECGRCDLQPAGTDLLGQPAQWTVGKPSSRLVDPGMPIPPEASAVHHILDEDVRGLRQPWGDHRAELLQGLYGKPIVFAAHNAKFEKSWFAGTWVEKAPWVCTYKCALRLWPDAPKHNNQALRYWRKPAGLPRHIGDAHRAGPDAHVTAFLLRDMLEATPLADLIKWSSEPALLPRCLIGKWRNNGKGTPWSEVDDGFLEWILGRDFDEDTLFTARTELERRWKEEEEERRRWRETHATLAAGRDDDDRPF